MNSNPEPTAGAGRIERWCQNCERQLDALKPHKRCPHCKRMTTYKCIATGKEGRYNNYCRHLALCGYCTPDVASRRLLARLSLTKLMNSLLQQLNKGR